MDKLIIVRKNVHDIDEWTEGKDFQEYYDNFVPPFKDVEIYIKDIDLRLKCYCKGTYVNIYLSIDGGNNGHFRMKISDKEILKNHAHNLQGDDVARETLLHIGGFYRLLMAYITHYKKVIIPQEPREVKSKHKRNNSKRTEYTYIFNSKSSEYKGGHHASPSYSFKVRGHFRHLKNGKRIWINEYTKGKEKPKERVYKL